MLDSREAGPLSDELNEISGDMKHLAFGNLSVRREDELRQRIIEGAYRMFRFAGHSPRLTLPILTPGMEVCSANPNTEQEVRGEDLDESWGWEDSFALDSSRQERAG